MKQQRLVMLLLLILTALAACSPGHNGSNIVAFIRDGHLWTIDPDGANAFAIVTQNTPVIGYSWSPTHQIIAYRTLDPDFAKTPAGKQFSHNPITGLAEDVPSTANTIGIDGGTPIPIAFSSPDSRYSNAIWTTNGSRLLYRSSPNAPLESPDTVGWWVSQNDQPGGIAIKSLPNSYSIPSLSYLTANYLALGNSNRGVFTTMLTGTNEHILLNDLLPGHPLVASLERILWRPAHQDQAFLYAVAAASSQQTADAAHFMVQLLLRTLDGHTTTIASCSCTQFAWSPDGNSVLYSTGSAYTIVDVRNASTFTINAEQESVPYWSPDSHFMLLDGLHTLTLINVAMKQPQTLLSDKADLTQVKQARLSTPNMLLQPVVNSLWASDSRHFLFLTRNRFAWSGHQLTAKNGLYTITVDDAARPQGTPALVDDGNDMQAGWSYQDANISFLF